MLGGGVAKRYADALYTLAVERDIVEQVEADLVTVTKTLEEYPEMARFLLNPVINAKVKKDQVRQLFGTVLSPIVVNFLQLLLDRHRENQLQAIKREYVRRVDEARERVKAHIETAYPLAETELVSVEQKLGASCGKTVQLTASVNPDLIAGARIRIGDRVLDASVKGQLDRFRESLKRYQVR
jgi:F-type H+-transporting ATPase subunit delta